MLRCPTCSRSGYEMMITRKRIRAGEQRLVDDGMAHLVPEFRRLMVQTMWSQRVSCLFTLVLIVVLLVP